MLRINIRRMPCSPAASFRHGKSGAINWGIMQAQVQLMKDPAEVLIA